MSIISGSGIEISATDEILYNGISLDKIVYDGIIVWEKMRCINIWKDGYPLPQYQPVISQKDGFNYEFNVRNNCYGCIISGLDYESGGDVDGGMVIPKVITSGCTTLKWRVDYADTSAGWWFMQIFDPNGYGSDKSDLWTPLFTEWGYHINTGNAPGTEFSIDVSGHDELIIQIYSQSNHDVDMSGSNECYIDYIILEP